MTTELTEQTDAGTNRPLKLTHPRDWAMAITVRHLWAMMPGTATLMLTLAVVSALLGITVPLLLGRTVAAVSAGGLRAPLTWAAVLIATLLVSEVIGAVQGLMQQFAFRRIEKDVQQRTSYSFVRGPGLRAAEDPEQKGTSERVLESMWQLTNGLVAAVALFPSSLVSLIGSTIAVGVVFNWWFALALLATSILQSAMNSKVVGDQLDLWGGSTETQKHAEYAFKLSLDAGAKEARIFGLGDYLVERYTNHELTALRPWWRKRWGFSGRQGAIGALRSAVMIGALARAAHLVQTSRMDVGTLTATASLVLAFTYLDVWGHAFVKSASKQITWLEQISPPSDEVALARIQTGVLTAPEPLRTTAPEIVFDEVSFAYPARPDTLVLDGLTWRLPSGQATALVGVNGAGKSTLVKLLTGGHRPTRGRILIDGVDLAALDDDELAAWQRRIAPITQDFLRLPLAAGDNVNVGSGQLWSGLMDGSDHPHDELDALAVRAGLTDLVDRLPSGWASVLDKTFTGGTDLSGGEWQRIGLARALRAGDAGAGLLVLDEPAAALDVESESRLMHSYLDLAAQATSLLISHRFSVVRPVPTICVLDGGRITESGSHEQLMATGGEYARLFTMQASRYLEASENDEPNDDEPNDDEPNDDEPNDDDREDRL